MADAIDITGTFRFTRLASEHEELLAEGPLTAGRMIRPVSDSSPGFVSLSFELGTLQLFSHDGEHWNAPSLTLDR
jgi:hypothetical protein